MKVVFAPEPGIYACWHLLQSFCRSSCHTFAPGNTLTRDQLAAWKAPALWQYTSWRGCELEGAMFDHLNHARRGRHTLIPMMYGYELFRLKACSG